MPPTLAGSPAVRHNNANSTNYVGNAPAGIVADEILIAQVLVRAGSVSITSLPTGWTLVSGAADGANATCTYTYWKRAAAGEPATYTWSGGTSAYSSVVIQRVSGCPPSGSPLSGAPAVLSNSSSTTTTFPSIITDAAGTLLFCVGGRAAAAAADNWSGGLTEIWDVYASGTGVARTLYAATLVLAGAGATGAFTCVSATNVPSTGITFALPPPAPPVVPGIDLVGAIGG